LQTYEQKLLAKVPSEGKSVGNTTLRSQLGWDDDVYWSIRGRLIDRGILERGRGRGGSVKRSLLVTPAPDARSALSPDREATDEEVASIARPSEDSLYEPMAGVLRDQWVKEKRYDNAIVEITARQGARLTGGK